MDSNCTHAYCVSHIGHQHCNIPYGKGTGRYKVTVKGIIAVVTLIVLALSILQITFGTEVREKIDEVASHLEGSYRESWITCR
jgi:hypothetical protein